MLFNYCEDRLFVGSYLNAGLGRTAPSLQIFFLDLYCSLGQTLIHLSRYHEQLIILIN